MDQNVEEVICSTSELAKILGLSPRRIRQLRSENVLTQVGRGRFKLVDSVQAYINFLQQGTTGKLDKHDYNREKALLAKIKRQKAEIELEIMRGDVHRSEDVKAVLSDMLTAFRSRILAIPTKLAPRLIAQTELTIIQDLIKGELYEALSELSEYDPAEFHKRNKECVAARVSKNGEEDQEEGDDE